MWCLWRNFRHFILIKLKPRFNSIDNKLIDLDYYRYKFLINDLEINDSLEFECGIPLPNNLIRYNLVFDLVSENICWFANNGSKEVTLKYDNNIYEIY